MLRADFEAAAVLGRRRRDAVDCGADHLLLLGDGLGQRGVLFALLAQLRSQLHYLQMFALVLGLVLALDGSQGWSLGVNSRTGSVPKN